MAFPPNFFERFETLLNEEFGKVGWAYRDLPWLREDEYNRVFHDAAGEENFVILAQTIYKEGGYKYIRGQYLIEPDALHRMAKAVIEEKERSDRCS